MFMISIVLVNAIAHVHVYWASSSHSPILNAGCNGLGHHCTISDLWAIQCCADCSRIWLLWSRWIRPTTAGKRFYVFLCVMIFKHCFSDSDLFLHKPLFWWFAANAQKGVVQCFRFHSNSAWAQVMRSQIHWVTDSVQPHKKRSVILESRITWTECVRLKVVKSAVELRGVYFGKSQGV